MARRRFHFKRRRNPAFRDLRGTLPLAAWAIAGGVGTQWATRLALGANDRGVVGWVGNAIAGIALSMLADKTIGGDAGKGILIGASVQVVGRVISETTRMNLVQFGQPPAMGRMGAYGPYAFTAPSYSGRALLPAAQGGAVNKPAAGNGMAGMGRRTLAVA